METSELDVFPCMLASNCQRYDVVTTRIAIARNEVPVAIYPEIVPICLLAANVADAEIAKVKLVKSDVLKRSFRI